MISAGAWRAEETTSPANRPWLPVLSCLSSQLSTKTQETWKMNIPPVLLVFPVFWGEVGSEVKMLWRHLVCTFSVCFRRMMCSYFPSFIFCVSTSCFSPNFMTFSQTRSGGKPTENWKCEALWVHFSETSPRVPASAHKNSLRHTQVHSEHNSQRGKHLAWKEDWNSSVSALTCRTLWWPSRCQRSGIFPRVLWIPAPL